MIQLHEVMIEGSSWTLADAAERANTLRTFGQNSSGDLLDRLVRMALGLKRREQDLLEANNRYLQRAREAEDALAESIRVNGLLAQRLREVLQHISAAA